MIFIMANTARRLICEAQSLKLGNSPPICLNQALDLKSVEIRIRCVQCSPSKSKNAMNSDSELTVFGS